MHTTTTTARPAGHTPIAWAVFAALVAACDPGDHDGARRLEGLDLSRFGIEQVLVDADAQLRATLVDPAGEVIGEVAHGRDGSTISSFHGDEIVTRTVGSATELACNDEILELAGGAGGLSSGEVERMAACDDAMAIAEVVLPALMPAQTPVATPEAVEPGVRPPSSLTDPSAEPSAIPLECVYWQTIGCVHWSEALGCEVTQRCLIWTCAWGDLTEPHSGYECTEQPHYW